MKTIIFSFISIMIMAGSPKDKKFSFTHTLESSASPEQIWRIWTDVAHWQDWDAGLQSAELFGEFAVGTKGKLIPDKGPKAKFEITDLEQGKSYTFSTQLPLGKLHVKRILATHNGKTVFTHKVWFTGLTKGIFARSMGKRYEAILPEVMEKVRKIAEK